MGLARGGPHVGLSAPPANNSGCHGLGPWWASRWSLCAAGLSGSSRPAPRRQRSAGADAGEDQFLFVEGQLEEAEDDAVDEEVELGSAGAVGADLAMGFEEGVAE